MRIKQVQTTLGILPVVVREADAIAVYDLETGEIVASVLPCGPWPLAKSKWLREHGAGHKCIYLGWPAGSKSS